MERFYIEKINRMKVKNPMKIDKLITICFNYFFLHI